MQCLGYDGFTIWVLEFAILKLEGWILCGESGENIYFRTLNNR